MRLVRLKIVRFSEIFMRLHGKKKLPRSMDKVFPVFHSHIIRVCVCVCEEGEAMYGMVGGFFGPTRISIYAFCMGSLESIL